MANGNRFDNLTFERPPSTFAPLPIDALVKSGETLNQRFKENQQQADLISDFIANHPRIAGVDDDNLTDASEALRQQLGVLNEAGDFEHQGRRVRRLARDVGNNKVLRQIRENATTYDKYEASLQDMVTRGIISPEQAGISREAAKARFSSKGGTFNEGNTNVFSPELPVNVNLPDRVQEFLRGIQPDQVAQYGFDANLFAQSGKLVLKNKETREVTRERIKQMLGSAFASDAQIQAYLRQQRAFSAEGFAVPDVDQAIDDAIDFGTGFAYEQENIRLTAAGLNTASGSTTTTPGRNPAFNTEIIGNTVPVNDIPIGETSQATTGDLRKEFTALTQKGTPPSKAGVAGTTGTFPIDFDNFTPAEQKRYNELQALNDKTLDSSAQILTDPDFDGVRKSYPGLADVYRQVIESDIKGIPAGVLDGDGVVDYLASQQRGGTFNKAVDNKVTNIYNQKAAALKARTIETVGLSAEESEDSSNLLFSPTNASLGKMRGFTFFQLGVEGVGEGITGAKSTEDIISDGGFKDIKEFKEHVSIADRVVPYDGRGEHLVTVGDKSYLMSSNNEVDIALNRVMGEIGSVVTGQQSEKKGVALGLVGEQLGLDPNMKFTVKAVDNIDPSGEGSFNGREIFLIPEESLLDADNNPVQAIPLSYIEAAYKQSVPLLK